MLGRPYLPRTPHPTRISELFSSRPFSNTVHLAKGIPMPPRSLVQCPACPSAVRSDRLEQHLLRVHHISSFDAQASVDQGLVLTTRAVGVTPNGQRPNTPVRCPNCGFKLNRNDLAQHLIDAHSRQLPVPPRPSPVKLTLPGSPSQRATRQPTGKIKPKQKRKQKKGLAVMRKGPSLPSAKPRTVTPLKRNPITAIPPDHFSTCPHGVRSPYVCAICEPARFRRLFGNNDD